MMRIRAYEILKMLFDESEDSIKEFLDHKESITHMFSLPKFVQAQYKGHAELYCKFIDMLEAIVKKNYHIFNDYIIKKGRILRTNASILLDSDSLGADIVKKNKSEDKLKIVQRMFKFVGFLISDDMSDH
jgi:hypothetical protein